jgi:hypothetical protein
MMQPSWAGPVLAAVDSLNTFHQGFVAAGAVDAKSEAGATGVTSASGMPVGVGAAVVAGA